MAEKTREELEAELDDAKRRADSAEKERDDAKAELDAKKDAEEKAAEKERADKALKDAEEAKEREESEKKDKARKDRHDSEKHDGAHKDCARCDESEKAEGERQDGAATAEINANREQQIADSKRITELEARLAEVLAGQKPLTHEDANAVSAAFHRADSVYQMLGERTPQILPGERPAAYRRRLADGLRKHTQSFKDERIHDSVSGRAFDIVEDRIYAEALEEAKNPSVNDSVGVLREVVTVNHGKTKREFFGDSRVAWEPFMPPVGVKITRFTKPDAR